MVVSAANIMGYLSLSHNLHSSPRNPEGRLCRNFLFFETYVIISVYIHTYVYIYMYIYIYVYLYIYMYQYIYMYIYIIMFHLRKSPTNPTNDQRSAGSRLASEPWTSSRLWTLVYGRAATWLQRSSLWASVNDQRTSLELGNRRGT